MTSGIFGTVGFEEGYASQRDVGGFANNNYADGEAYSSVRSPSSSAIFSASTPVGNSYGPSLWQSRDGGSLLAVQGEIILRNGNLLVEKNWEESVLELLIAAPKETVCSFDGAFLLAFYNERIRTLILASDRFGNFALHYRLCKGGIAFATHVSSLAHLSDRATLDQVGLAQHLALGYVIGGKTLVSQVSRLAAASTLIANTSGITSEPYYRPKYVARTRASKTEMSRVADQFADSFRTSVAARVAHSDDADLPVCAALSGGFDTRIIWSALHSLGKSDTVKAFTLGLPDSTDIEIARSITDKLGIRHLPIYFDDDFLSKTANYWVETVERTEGGYGITSATTIQAFYQQQKDYRFLLDGHGGGLYRRFFMRSKKQTFAKGASVSQEMLRILGRPLLSSPILSEDIKIAAGVEAELAMRNFLSDFSDIGEVGDVLDHYYITQVSANKTALSGNGQLAFLELRHPLLNLASYELVQTIPEELRKSNWIYKQVVQRLCPELAQFPLDDQGYKVPYAGFLFFRYPIRGLDKARELTSVLLKHRFLNNSRSHHPLIKPTDILMRHLPVLLTTLEDKKHAVQDFVDEAALQQAITSLRSGNTTDLNAIVQLVDLAILLSYFKL
jgi:asparagine synthetase B (glutamine-hydrolysing)